MPDIVIIGQGLRGFKSLAAEKGYTVRLFKGPETAMKSIPSASLLVVDHEGKGSYKEVLNSAKDMPKIIVSHNGISRKIGPWLKAPLSYPIHAPSDRELLSFVERVMKETRRLSQVSEMQLSLKEVKREIKFFEKMNRKLTSSLDINEILGLMMTHVEEMTGAESWAILLVDEDTGDLVLEKADGKSHKRRIHLKPGEGIAGWVAKTGKPVVVPDVAKDKRFDPKRECFIRKKIRSVMCAPVVSKGSTVGVIEVMNRENGEPFSDNDLKVLNRLVDHTAIALERIALQQRLEELVVTDDLTSLFNSRYLNRSIETEILRSKRYSSSVSVIFMDIDYFKNINDTYGHLSGSKVLVEVAQILIDQLRSIDIVARYGGDEFVIVLPQTELSNAMSIAERIREAIERFTFLKDEGLNLKMTASFGVAAYPESAHSQEELLRIADESMYKVKHRTRNGVYAII